MFPVQPVGTASRLISKIYNFYCSVIFHLALSPGMYHVLVYFCMDLFIHKYSFLSVTYDSFEKVYIAFSISATEELLAPIAVVITIPLTVIYFSIAALH